jgi:hypothetical protein
MSARENNELMTNFQKVINHYILTSNKLAPTKGDNAARLSSSKSMESTQLIMSNVPDEREQSKKKAKPAPVAHHQCQLLNKYTINTCFGSDTKKMSGIVRPTKLADEPVSLAATMGHKL